MFVKPRSAFVGCPSVVWSSSGSAKNARYARLLPSTRKSSDVVRRAVVEYELLAGQRLRAHPATVSSSVPCVACPAPLGLAGRPHPDRRRRRRPPPPAAAVGGRRRRGCRARRAAIPARGRAARRPAAPGQARDDRRRAARPARSGRAGRSEAGGARDRPRSSWRSSACRTSSRRSSSQAGSARRLGAARPRAAAAAPAGARVPRPRARPRRRRPGSRGALRSRTAPRRASTGRSSRPTSCSSSRRPRPCSTAAPARCSLRATPPPSVVPRPRTRSYRQPASPPGSSRSQSSAQSRARVALTGVSLVLDHPRLTGRFRGLPARARVTRARLGLAVPAPLLAPACRDAPRRILRDQGRAIAATAAFAGTPSVAHAEALVRERRASRSRARRARRRARRRRAVDRAAPPARAAQPRDGGGDVARARAAALAGRLPVRARRDARARPLPHAHVRARHAGAVPATVRRAPGRAATRSSASSRAHGSRGRTRARCVPRPAAPATRCFRTRTGRDAGRRCRASAGSSSPAAGTQPRRVPSGSSRATRSRARSRWRTGWRVVAPASASCSRRPTRRCSSARARQASPLRRTPSAM